MSTNSRVVSPPPAWVILALLVIPVAGAIWFGFVSVAPLAPDQWWNEHVIAPKDTTGFLIAEIFHLVGSTKGMAAVTAVVLILLIVLKRWPAAFTMASTMATVLVASKLIKFFVDRPRPTDMLIFEDETSFPSGHSLGAGAIATVLVCFVFASNKINKTLQISAVVIGTVYVLLMMWSRTALHVHWLSDTVAGALLGVALALIYARIFLFKEPKARGRHAVDTSKHS